MPTRIIRPYIPPYNRHPEGPWKHLSYAPANGLKAAREAKGWTLQDLSEVSGYSVAQLAEIEATPSEPRPRIVTAKLSAFLGVSTDTVRAME